MGFPDRSVVKNLPASAADMNSVPGSGRFPGEGNGNSLQYSYPEDPMDRGVWQATVHGVTKSWTRLSDFHFLFTYLPWWLKTSSHQKTWLSLSAQLTLSRTTSLMGGRPSGFWIHAGMNWKSSKNSLSYCFLPSESGGFQDSKKRRAGRQQSITSLYVYQART